MPKRVTVNSVLADGTRLRDVWIWAKTLGLRHFHVIKVGAYSGQDFSLDPAELPDFQTDLTGICTDMFADLEAGRAPIDYQPTTKIVRRLMIPQPVTRFCGVAGSYLGAAANGKVYPCFRHLGPARYEVGDTRGRSRRQQASRFHQSRGRRRGQPPGLSRLVGVLSTRRWLLRGFHRVRP